MFGLISKSLVELKSGSSTTSKPTPCPTPLLPDTYGVKLSANPKGSNLSNIESYTLALINNKSDYVTEQGDVEDWKNNSSVQKEKLLENLQTYIDIVSKHVQ